MRKAASYFVGCHDFRNYCKFDASKNIENYERTMLHAEIREELNATVDTTIGGIHSPFRNGVQMMAFDVKGTAFLWHQVRCMMSILFMVGQGKEQPEIVLDLFDIKRFPIRPQYPIAPEIPLVLWECGYDKQELDLHLMGSADTHLRIQEQMLSFWEEYMSKSMIIYSFLRDVLPVGHASLVGRGQDNAPIRFGSLESGAASKHTPLAERGVCGTNTPEERNRIFQERRERKRKLDTDEAAGQ
jgi:tRNA pseudouridine38/39 synthase